VSRGALVAPGSRGLCVEGGGEMERVPRQKEKSKNGLGLGLGWAWLGGALVLVALG
jgi:hypothetical protein